MTYKRIKSLRLQNVRIRRYGQEYDVCVIQQISEVYIALQSVKSIRFFAFTSACYCVYFVFTICILLFNIYYFHSVLQVCVLAFLGDCVKYVNFGLISLSTISISLNSLDALRLQSLWISLFS